MTPEDQRLNYQTSCTHYRKGNVVHDINGSVVFTGKSVNKAKAHVRKEHLRSYTIPVKPAVGKVVYHPPYEPSGE